MLGLCVYVSRSQGQALKPSLPLMGNSLRDCIEQALFEVDSRQDLRLTQNAR